MDSESRAPHETQRNGWGIRESNREENKKRLAFAESYPGEASSLRKGDENHCTTQAQESKTMTFENYIKARLMDLAIEDGYSNGGVDVMLAVAQVMRNRVQAGWQGGDWLKVIDTAGEYRGTDKTGISVRMDPKDGNFRELMKMIDDVYYGTADDTTVNTRNGKSLYYAELHNVTRVWFQEQILNDHESHPRLAKVGQLTFFG